MKISRDDDFGGVVLNCAVRYALGRMSYMPGLVMDTIKPMLKDCSDKTLWCFNRDVSEWLENCIDERSDAIAYRREWEEFQHKVSQEIENRRGNRNGNDFAIQK